jgi:hypothetical protein
MHVKLEIRKVVVSTHNGVTIALTVLILTLTCLTALLRMPSRLYK